MICFILTAPPHSFLSEKAPVASAEAKEPDCSVINADPEGVSGGRRFSERSAV